MTCKFFVRGNFKMNPTTQSGLTSLINRLNQANLNPNTEVIIAPSSIYLYHTKGLVHKDVTVSAQNCHFKESGAYTGEISPKQLVDAEIPYVILGHSERHTHFKETSEIIAQKVHTALDNNLKVILCIGETLAEREAGMTATVIQDQLVAIIKVTKKSDWSNIVIAYEPVWAIGTGKVAMTSQAQETHADIRTYLDNELSIGTTTHIIYSSSVSRANCMELAKQNDIDGFLVGRASLKPEFVDIVNSRHHPI